MSKPKTEIDDILRHEKEIVRLYIEGSYEKAGGNGSLMAIQDFAKKEGIDISHFSLEEIAKQINWSISWAITPLCTECDTRPAKGDGLCDICFTYKEMIKLIDDPIVPKDEQDVLILDVNALVQELGDHDLVKRCWYLVYKIGEEYPHGQFPMKRVREVARELDIDDKSLVVLINQLGKVI
jgi:hypothetical protein